MDIPIEIQDIVNEMQTRYPKETTICVQALQIQKLAEMLETEVTNSAEKFDYEDA